LWPRNARNVVLPRCPDTPTREDLAKLDRKRAKKGSNEEWEHPEDPDAKITKMKDGQTHLAHKAEHAVDMETGAVLAVTLQDANAGDTTTVQQTLIAVAEQMEKLTDTPETAEQIAGNWLTEVVADKGYHSNETMVDLKEFGIRSYISEPKRGQRNWIGKQAERDTVYANRRRIQGERGKSFITSSRTDTRTAICSLLRDGSNEASTHSRAGEHSQTAPHPRRRFQSESHAAPDDRQRHPARPPGPRRRLRFYLNCPD